MEHIASHDSLASTTSSKKQSEKDVEKALDDEKPQPKSETKKDPKLVRRKLVHTVCNIIRLILYLQGRMGRRRPGTTVQLERAPQMDRHHCRIRLRLHITHGLVHRGTSTIDHLPRV